MPKKSRKSTLQDIAGQVKKEIEAVINPHPEIHIPREDELPPDIQEAIRVMSGGRPQSFANEFQPNLEGYPKFQGAAFGGTSAQEEFIKKKDPIEIRVRYEDNQIHVLDVFTEVGKQKYSEVMKTVGDPESGIILAEEPKDPEILLDSAAAGGVRAILILKTSKPVPYQHKLGPGYQVVGTKDDEGLDAQEKTP